MKDNFKSGFTAIIGRPNVGKSTLMNHLIGQKIAITSKKPQTTRNRIQTVYTCEDGQIVFLDTPGIHKAKNKLGEYMVQVAERTLKDVDVILWLVEPTTFIGAGERHIAEQLKGLHLPVILVINKVDTVDKDEILKAIDTYRKLKPIYDRYKMSKDKEKFLRGFESEIILFEAAARDIKKAGLTKLPSSEKLKAELDGLAARKTVLQAELRKIQREEKKYDTLRQNVDTLLERPKEQEQQRQRNNDLE